jgi:NosR/NirI family transcriptional regulator, nitrous oxide reductase regulator
MWIFVLVTFVAWGRGVFCGWLCPFGALREPAAEVSLALRIKQWRVPDALDVHLRKLKYVTLAVIIFATLKSPGLADAAAEVEPFKTSITLIFVRHWPFVVYALGLIAVNLFVYKAFCRYLCPLGAAMAIGGKLRIDTPGFGTAYLQGHFTAGGMEDRIESTFPPVFNPKIVPRS